MIVSVPLFVGICFILLLSYELSESNRLLQRELRVKDAIITYINAVRCTTLSSRCAVIYTNCKDPFYKLVGEANERQAQRVNEHLLQLHKEDKQLPIPEVKLSQTQLDLLGPKSSLEKDMSEMSMILLGQKRMDLANTSEALLPLRHVSDKRAKVAFEAADALRSTLIAGMIVSLVVSIALTMFFFLSITNRLKVILENTVSLSNGNPLTSPLRGTDEIAELDQFLYKSATEIRELERFKRDMVGVISQELESPLASVGTFLTCLSEGKYGDLAPKAIDKVQRTSHSVRRLIGLVADLLYMDKLELEMRPADISVEELLNASVDAVKELSIQSGIRIALRNRAATVYADRGRLIQVVVNLLSNAMKFSPQNGEITIEAFEHDGWFECRISDQGRGIPENFRKQIFEPFKQVDAKDAIAKKGTGLGLTISRSIVEQHGGVIGVDSEEGKGSTFWYRIPATACAFSIKPVQENQFPAVKAKNWQGGKGSWKQFTVLKQGLVIISVPLLFQLAFVSAIGSILDQIYQQARGEEISKRILISLNEAADEVVDATRYAMMYLYTKNPDCGKLWLDCKNKTIGSLNLAEKLSTEPAQIKDIRDCRASLEEFSSSLYSEAERLAARDEFKSLRAMGSVQLSSMNPVLFEKNLHQLVSQVRLLVKDAAHMKLFKPFLEAQIAQDSLMRREKIRGESLAAERMKWISILNMTLYASIVLNVILSVFLVIFLMKNLTNRLRHVMENTARIVKREPLDPSKKGNDEIAYLDEVLFETGNRLIALENFKRDLIGIVSHELRTPLMAVCTVLELLTEGILGALSEEGMEKLAVAKYEAARLVRLINDLLDIEKMEAGKFVLDMNEVKISDIIEPSTAAVAPLAVRKQIRVELSDRDRELKLHADRERLCQVLINLLSTGIKSSETGTLDLAVQSNSTEVEFRVIDHDRVLPAQVKDKLFDRFVKVDESIFGDGGSSGLGLAISKAIVEQHGGIIGVDSEIGSGSTFWFKLPLSKVPAAT